jgi:tRNA (cmo5U34)-methyltransferase
MTNHFDNVAQSWDNNPVHLERTRAIATEILNMIPMREGMKALEFGSGTGLLSFALRDRFAEITLMDSSVEMHKQAVIKIQNAGLSHFTPLFFDLEKEDYTKGAFDIIFTQMVMHHVKDVAALIRKFYTLLNPGGFIAIADLYTEDGTFHDRDFDGHFGFDPDYMIDMVTASGFKNAVIKPCFEIKRPDEGNGGTVFPVFLLVAVK